jgi:hypothetical protein
MAQRNLQLDYLKLILSILVITIHIPVSSNYTLNFFTGSGLARIAVPLFLIINGYYLNLDDVNKFKKLIQRLAILYIVWMLIYLPFYINESDLYFKVIKGYFHLWYLIGLFGAAILMFALKKLKLSNKSILIIGLFIFLLGWTIQLLRAFDFQLPVDLLSRDGGTRNFFFFSFPFVAIGYSLKSMKFSNLILQKLPLFLSLSFILLISETLFYYILKSNYGQDFFLSTLLISPLLFLAFKDKPKVEVDDDFFSKIFITIYLLHPLVIFLLASIFPNMENTMRFILVVFFTITFSINIIQLNRKMKFFL